MACLHFSGGLKAGDSLESPPAIMHVRDMCGTRASHGFVALSIPCVVEKAMTLLSENEGFVTVLVTPVAR